MPTAKNKIWTRRSALPKSKKKKNVLEAHLGHSNKMFRFPSPRLLWWSVGRSVGQSGKKKKEWTLEVVWVPENAGLLRKKAWLQSQLENVVFSTIKCLNSLCSIDVN